ncbi:protein-glutamate methylesterase/protein-glutamine glutaminase [Thiolapillus brandeum]|uniref:Protein-glutamate methylesterase/protein-glutamine glutaminase n=1 Tax=Thiolapillus brandeum TaxID=1076588 RepID=A0A7U6JJM2_9GAMM|nr:chemotaxis response regulator protein-glutamate methylesterase [Thiolapillus brandeum]BAO45040.1 protein-glutamate methylesterase two-component system chemotaxis family response regulator CheB [Thiolapillus brandeum]
MSIRVLVIDDSALVRNLLKRILDQDPQIKVVGTAADAYIAREKIKKLHPDVLTLDVEMPKMDGITFLQNLMRLHPMPVIMVSSLTAKGADVTLKALELGAIDFVCKPQGDFSGSLESVSEEIVQKIKTAAKANIHAAGRKRTSAPLTVEEKQTVDAVIPATSKRQGVTGLPPLLAIGASTGGTEAIKDVLVELPTDMPAIVITQHIPPGFSTAFAQRMNRLASLTVHEAREGQQILPGNVYIAPGAQHLLVARNDKGYYCRLSNGPRVNRHKPSVDVLFRSVAQTAGRNATGVILTGMGDDGARSLLEMREAGARTIAQDEESSVVWGMPGAAVKQGAAEQILPLNKIPATLIYLLSSKGKTKPASGSLQRLRAATAASPSFR